MFKKFFEEESHPQIPRGIAGLEMRELRFRFDAIRQEIKREDDLVNQRNTWCLLSTTALVTGIIALARFSTSTHEPLPPGAKELCAVVLLTLAGSGITLSTYCRGSVDAARRQIEYLFKVYTDNEDVFLDAGLFRPFGEDAAHRKGIGYSQALPRVIFYMWTIILCASMVVSWKIMGGTALSFFNQAGPTLHAWLGALKGIVS